MKTYRASLIGMAGTASGFIPVGPGEIAVVGRSNAGKSTLINVMTGNKQLARVSNQPGRTRTIVFFDIEERFVLVDLPGYGYAKGAHDERQQWRILVQAYFDSNRPIAGVMTLFDIRREPDDLDKGLLAMLAHNRVPTQVIWTKADKLAKTRVQATARAQDKKLGNASPGLAFSSLTRLGRDAAWEWVEERLVSIGNPPTG